MHLLQPVTRNDNITTPQARSISKTQNDSSNNNQKKDFICWYCQEDGHYKNQCPHYKKSQEEEANVAFLYMAVGTSTVSLKCGSMLFGL